MNPILRNVIPANKAIVAETAYWINREKSVNRRRRQNRERLVILRTTPNEEILTERFWDVTTVNVFLILAHKSQRLLMTKKKMTNLSLSMVVLGLRVTILSTRTAIIGTTPVIIVRKHGILVRLIGILMMLATLVTIVPQTIIRLTNTPANKTMRMTMVLVTHVIVVPDLTTELIRTVTAFRDT